VRLASAALCSELCLVLGTEDSERRLSQFERVELDSQLGTIVWPGGADMAPETLHFRVTKRTGQNPGVAGLEGRGEAGG
jgi:hypothetical protein